VLQELDATKESMAGGWLHTGDLAMRHPNGSIQVKDRAKDIIISGGENVSSIEVETLLSSHPAMLGLQVLARACASPARPLLRRRLPAAAAAVARTGTRITLEAAPDRAAVVMGASSAESAAGAPAPARPSSMWRRFSCTWGTAASWSSPVEVLEDNDGLRERAAAVDEHRHLLVHGVVAQQLVALVPRSSPRSRTPGP